MSVKTKRQATDSCKRRHERYQVLIGARMRAGGQPVDVCIRDVSLRGICIVTTTPPPRGTIIELNGPSLPMVGQVVWSSERRCGVAIGGRIDLPGPLARRPVAPAPHEVVPLPAYARAPEPWERATEKSRERGKAMQFVFMVVSGAAAATSS